MNYSATITAQNTEQMSLEDALIIVDENADKKWKEAAMNEVYLLCKTYPEMTTDDVWKRLESLDVATKEHRAMGPIMMKAVKNGWCRASGSYVKSERPECHKRPISLYISNFISVSY
jgi:hypothetical protein